MVSDIICYYWPDPKWKNTEDAHNAILVVDYHRHEYKYAITNMVVHSVIRTIFEVKRKQDILDYVKALKESDFKQIPFVDNGRISFFNIYNE